MRALLDHFAKVKDARQAWKVMYPLREVLFLAVCGTIASGDDYDDIVDWGNARLALLRGFAEFHFGIPRADWLRSIMNRIDPDLFMDCFTSWSRNAGRTSSSPWPSTATALPSLDKLTALNALYLVGRPELMEDLALQQLRSRGVI